MLSKLHIQHYAIIDELQISFCDSLNIITGETGAGKSILMGALNLVLGERADSTVLLRPDKKCVVEASFNVKDNQQVSVFLSNNDLDKEDEIIIRREIAPNGKSRSFINDTPVNLSQLKSLAVLLVDLHQQFDTLELHSENFQREALDAFSGNGTLLLQLKAQYDKYAKALKELHLLQEEQHLANKELDYNKYLFTELEELSLKENELEELDIELKLLSNAEHVKRQLFGIYAELKDGEQPIIQQLKSIQHKLRALNEYHADIKQLNERLQAAAIEIQDVADELERIDDSVHADPQRIEKVNERIAQGYKLLKKHGVQHTADLMRIQAELEQKLNAVYNISGTIHQLEKQVTLLHDACIETAKEISQKRQAQLKPFADKINKLLAQVGMPNAKVKIELETATLSALGTDEIQFLFDANKSNRFEPISKVASGGELSRLMLSIKSLVANKLQLPTLIFDEIDTGISGEAARQVGIIMKDLAATHQLISITHQAQIAAKAAAHYFVYKEMQGEKIVTAIRLLNNDERITAIAKMLSGEKPTAAALENAREMVAN